MSNTFHFVRPPEGAELAWLETQMAKHGVKVIGKRLVGKFKTNPMLGEFGPGPDKALCQTCKHLVYNQCSKRYYKCALRGITGGPGTDHRVRWPACAKYEASK